VKVTARQDREPIVDGILSGWKEGTCHLCLFFQGAVLLLRNKKYLQAAPLKRPREMWYLLPNNIHPFHLPVPQIEDGKRHNLVILELGP